MAIAFGGYATGSNSGATSLTVASPSVSGSNLIGIVSTFHQTNENISSITWNGASMSFIARTSQEGSTRRIETWYILNPSAGSTNIVVTRGTGSGTLEAHVLYYTGAKQSGQPDASATTNDSGTTTFVSSITTVAANCWSTLITRDLTGNFSASTGATIRSSSGNPSVFDSNGALSAGSNSMSVTSDGGATDHIGVIVSFAPVLEPNNDNFFLCF